MSNQPEVVVEFDAGHGGTDPGALGNGLREKDLTLTIAKAAKKHLLDNYEGVVVKMTRESDATLSLLARTNKAISDQADSLVSIHINSATNAQAVGYEDFRHTSQSASSASGRLQSAIHDKVSPLFTKNRGKKQANYHMVREATVRPVGKKSTPSTLTECGFIVNKGDAELLKDVGFLTRLGVAHAEGVAAFHGLKRKQVSKPISTAEQKGIGRVTVQSDSLNLRDKPSLDGKIVKVLNKGESYNVYEIKDNWYRLSSTGWASIGSAKNLMSYTPHPKPTQSPHVASPAKPSATKRRMRRVIVDGKQVGAFEAEAGVIQAVTDALKAGPKKIEVEEV